MASYPAIRSLVPNAARTEEITRMEDPQVTEEIRRASSSDARALTELGRRTFAEAFGAQNTAANLAQFLDAAYGEEIQVLELQDPALQYLVVELDAVLVAFALLRSGKVSAFISDPSALEIQRFYLDAAHHGSGIAQRLMAACIAAARARHAETLFLGVWAHNPRALRFYAAQGFVEVGRQIFTVGNDPQTDLVLALQLDQPTGAACP